MHYEVEQKFPLPNTANTEAKLTELGAKFEPPIEQIDHYFRHPSRDFATTDEALRLRQVGSESFITYKGPKIDPATKTRRELELPLPAGAETIEHFTELLGALGFSIVAAVTKQRRKATIIWDGFEVECALDDVEGAGPFLELEISADNSSLENAKKCLTNLAGRLALEQSERRSYLELVLLHREK
ncbi:MAG TPA: class IV adenylate cyclase [Pirellulaceae bacterium]|jgi:adenylate cyclase class 2